MEGSYSKYFIIVIILLLLIFFINLLPYFHIYNEPTYVPSDILEKHQGLISLGGIIIAIIIFWWTLRKQNSDRKRDEKERRYRTSKALLRAIESQENFFNNSENTDFHREGNNIDLDMFDTSAYDSIINSGLFTHFKTDTQDCLSNLSTRIKYRNELIKGYIDIVLSHTLESLSISINEKIDFYQTFLMKLHQEIRNLLNAAKILLEKELMNVN